VDQRRLDIIKHFVGFVKKELNIQSLPSIKLISDKSWVETYRSFGEYNPQENYVKVFYPGRNIADVCRSLVHELIHHRQGELGMLSPDSGQTGSEIENEANALAGIIMRDYGKLNLSVYDLDTINESLNERKQVGLLYHFTSYVGLKGIIEDNMVLKTWQTDIQPYVSFTRNKNFQSDTIPTQVRITVDGDKLSDKYRIAPHADTEAGYGRRSQDEAEERISLKRYPDGVSIKRSLILIEVKNPVAGYDLSKQTTDDEDMIEPPSSATYERVVKMLKFKKLPYKIVDKF
jgi:hypothetical protein